MEKSNIVDKVVSNTVPSLVEKTQSVVNSPTNESLLQQLTSNKLYIYIIIAIVVLAFIGYYLYTKHFSKNEKTSKSDKTEKSQDNDQTLKETQFKKHVLSPDTEYYLLDRSGNPVLMNQYFANFLQNNNDQSILVNNKIKPQEISTTKVSQQRPKLSHPNEDSQVEVNITDNEDDNIATQDLTREEIEELKNQLSMMQKKQSAPITAENDEDGDEANF